MAIQSKAIQAADLTVQGREVDRLTQKLLTDVDPRSVSPEEFLGARFDRGLAWVHLPEGRGGLGLDPSLQVRVEERCAEAGATSPADFSPVGYGMAGPILIRHGTTDQVDRYVRPAFTGEQLWCQLFSEPAAGSDLAAVRTRATLDGDTWFIEGQKVWTSMAHKAAFGLLLARTADTERKRDGLTMFMIDMNGEGVDVRPLIQMTGTAEFNEVFFSMAGAPDAFRIGAVNDGWRLAKETLSSERSMLGSTDAFGPRRVLDALRLNWNRSAPNLSPTVAAVKRHRMADLWVRYMALELLQRRLDDLPDALSEPGPVLKIVSAELIRDLAEEAVDALGPSGALYPSLYRFESSEHSMEFENEQQFFLRSRARTIGGGTSEILRNVVAERLLGLPR